MSEEPQLPAVTPEEIEQGKTMALLAWVSLFLGVPLWIVPLIQRDNEFALYHAKHAGMTFLASLVLVVAFFVIYIVTCGLGALLFPILLLPMVPTIDGLIKATGGKMEPPLAVGGFTDKVFGGLTADQKKKKS